MPEDPHYLAQQLSSQAETLMREGHVDEARALYLKASDWEARALHLVGPDKPRTLGILSVSLVSILCKAGDLQEAEKRACALLTNEDLPPFAHDQLRELLEVVWEEQTLLASTKQLTGVNIMVSLRGNDIGVGRAPTSLVLASISGIHSLLFRVTEFLGDYQFRTRGAPSGEVQDLCQPLVSQPLAGSYKFILSFTQPLQAEMFPTKRITAATISDWFVHFIQTVSPSAVDQMSLPDVQTLVPDKRYRQALLKLTRNIVPDGQRIKEIEFVRGAEPKASRALLSQGARFRIADSLRIDDPQSSDEQPPIVGVLRGLELDKKWLSVRLPDGKDQKCTIGGEVLDDVVGPMVNKKVKVSGKWNRQKTKFNLDDIELDVTS
ncbi:MAG: tetratricopeptide repeat protein [Chloroflexi bacterium]|nr:tetratricopeptide repeat protein [Chloroflexota bacterium]